MLWTMCRPRLLPDGLAALLVSTDLTSIKRKPRSNGVFQVVLTGKSLLLCADEWDQLDLLAPQLDFELIARLKVEYGGVGLANKQIAIALNGCYVARAATSLSPSSAGSITEADPFSAKQCFVEGGEVDALTTVFLCAHIAAAANEIGFRGIA